MAIEMDWQMAWMMAIDMNWQRDLMMTIEMDWMMEYSKMNKMMDWKMNKMMG